MKRIISMICLLLFCALLPCASAESTQKDKSLTVMVYMCGSNLESQNGSASSDIEEMLQSEYNLNQVNVLLMTGGSIEWKDYGASGKTTISTVNPNYTLRDVGQQVTDLSSEALDMGDPATLTMFLNYGIENYPASEYALILWDHGAGPLDGVCLDELHGNNRLSISELADALDEAELPAKLSWIGFDACLMGTAEVAQMVSPYAEYMIASQDTEPSYGWNYVFLKDIEKDADGAATGIRIIDTYFEGAKEGETGLTLSCIDLSKISGVITAMDDFFTPVGINMNETTFALLSNLRTSSTNFGKAARAGENDTGYDLVDLGDLLLHYGDIGNTWALRHALNDAVVYSRPTENGISGLSVYHPLQNKRDYLSGWAEAYDKLAFSNGYQDYLDAFGAMLTGEKMADWSNFVLRDDGFDEAMHNLYSLELTSEQHNSVSSAQLIVLGTMSDGYHGSIEEAQLAESGVQITDQFCYYPVWMGETEIEKSGRITATYTSRSLYLLDETGKPLAGPVSYELSDDGKEYYIFADYKDYSGLEDFTPSAKVMYICTQDTDSESLSIVRTEVYDQATRSYTRRIGFEEANYTTMMINRQARYLPEEKGTLPPCEEWKEASQSIELALPLKWHLQFFDAQLSGTPLYATLQVTDVQQNSYCTPLVRIQNPNLYDIDIFPRTVSTENFDFTLYAILDTSPLNPGLSLAAEITNTSEQTVGCFTTDIILNGTRSITGNGGIIPLSFAKMESGETGYAACRIDPVELTGISSLDTISLQLFVEPGDNSKDWYRMDLAYEISGGNLSALSSVSHQTTAEKEEDGIVWQLENLEKTADGGIAFVLHLINNTDKTFTREGSIVFNHVIQTENEFRIDVEPHTDQYCRVEIQNRTMLPSFKVEGSWDRRFLAEYNLLQKFGVSEINNITLTLNEGTGQRNIGNISFDLMPAYPFAAEEAVLRATEKREVSEKYLLEGDVSARVDRVLVGYENIGIRLTLQNHTDREIVLEIGNKRADERNHLFSENTYCVGAHASCVTCIMVEAWNPEETVSSVGMTFRYDGYTTQRAYIRFSEPISMETEGGTYLSPDQFITEPVIHGLSGEINILPLPSVVADSDVSLQVNMVNGYNRKPENIQDTTKLKLTLNVQNNSDTSHHYVFDEFLINGVRLVRTNYSYLSLEPGASGNLEIEIDIVQLTNISEITSVSCILVLDHNQNEEENTLLCFELEGCDISALTWMGEPLAETTMNGMVWQLLRLEDDKPSYYYGVIRVYNGSDVPYNHATGTHAATEILLNDISVDSRLYPQLVSRTQPPGTEIVEDFTFHNGADIDTVYFEIDGKSYPVPFAGQLLQSRGFDSVETVSIAVNADKDSGTIRDVIILELDKPWPLPERSDEQYSVMKGERVLLDEDVRVGLSYVLLGDNGIALTLSMENKTDKAILLELLDAMTGDEPREFFNDTRFCLAPKTVEIVTVPIRVEVEENEEKILDELHLSFRYNDLTYKDACIWPDIPMLMGSAKYIGSDHLFTVLAMKDGITTDADEEHTAVPQLGQISSFFEFVIRNTEDNSFIEPTYSFPYAEELADDQVYEPAIRVRNRTGGLITPVVAAIIDGELFTWDRVSIEDGRSWFFYSIGADLSNGECNTVFYIDGVEACSGTLRLEEKQNLTDLSMANVGELVYFGNYEQDNIAANGKEPIEWIVVDGDGDYALLVSRYGLDCKPYHDENAAVTWETCSLRTWLNRTFLREAFSWEEQLLIFPYEIYADENPEYETDPGNDTEDKVFLLSVAEAEYYFDTEESRRCYGTEYCYGQGAHQYSDGTCWWWLRTPGGNQNMAATVKGRGEIDATGGIVNVSANYGQGSYGAVRPVIIIDFNSTVHTGSEDARNTCPECGKENVPGIDFCIFCGTQITEPNYELDISSSFSTTYSVGDFITMGSYEQDNNTLNGKETIEWIVLKTESDRALVISRYALDGQKFHTQDTDITWETCTLRGWLNTRFLHDAFSEEERQQILFSEVPADKNPDYGSNAGKTTFDRLFLLSIPEAEEYLGTDEAKRCIGTEYSVARGANREWKGDHCIWWLRTPGETLQEAAAIEFEGKIRSSAMIGSIYAVRPAMWILY